MHRASAQLVNSFIYTRLIIYFAVQLRLDKRHPYSTIYANAVFYGAVIWVYEGRLPGGVALFVCMVKAIQELNKWTSEYVEK